ncbi:hypothetical protein QJS10_CPA06g02442 [Acorus calamus]|uniref:Protein kinase domain-containing protein n=1 Tax=Acorus calamus TaxID=4465 RepID=A0AAV9EKI3_ACOCL|nr:hypothetical protein QJS10_CPA06g02442 [Acorus calamus]
MRADESSPLGYQIALEGKGSLSKENDGVVELPKDHHLDERSNKGESILSDVRDPALLTKNSLSNVNSKPLPPSRMEKAHHKKHSDSEAFYKVNGKLYQKLGKIGSGGSCEVHKVIASDCTIYALKKIKLKGRDYPTAYGFCQEILYLNKLKGKNSIIQLIDYEVTDRELLEDVMNGSTKNMDGRIKNDAYIYMVLEYGEVDLAHMVAQKWKETDGSNLNIDENWL